LTRVEHGIKYLKPIRKINQHNFARFGTFPTGSVQANGSDHVDPTALDEISIGNEFEEIDGFRCDRRSDVELGYETSDNMLACSGISSCCL